MKGGFATGPGESLAMWLAWWRAYKAHTMEWPRRGRSRSPVKVPGTYVRAAVTRSTTPKNKWKAAHALPNRNDAEGTGRAHVLALRAYVPPLHYWGVRTRPYNYQN